MKAYNICWDIDEDIVDGSLPSEVDLPRGTEPDDVADWLSDEYSFCVFSFDLAYDDIDRAIECIKEINKNLAILTDYKPDIIDDDGNSCGLVLDGLEYNAEENVIKAWSHYDEV